MSHGGQIEARDILERENIRNALTGIKDGWDTEKKTYTRYEEENLHDPESEIVRFLLSNICRIPWHRGDKCIWEMYIEYREIIFYLSDMKISGFRIRSLGETEESHPVFDSLLNKLKAATRLFYKALKGQSEDLIDSENFFILNPRPRIWKIFYNHWERFCFALAEITEAVEHKEYKSLDFETYRRKPDQPYVDYHSSYLFNLDFHGAPAVSFYFSFTELLQVAILAFSDPRPCSLKELREMTWADAMKTILPISEDDELRNRYNELYRLKKRVRDIMMHGYGTSESILVKVEGSGLLPTGHIDPEGDIHRYHMTTFSPEISMWVFETIRDFHDWVETHDVGWYPLQYLETGKSIPFHPKKIQELREYLGDRPAFREKMQEEHEEHIGRVNYDLT